MPVDAADPVIRKRKPKLTGSPCELTSNEAKKLDVKSSQKRPITLRSYPFRKKRWFQPGRPTHASNKVTTFRGCTGGHRRVNPILHERLGNLVYSLDSLPPEENALFTKPRPESGISVNTLKG